MLSIPRIVFEASFFVVIFAGVVGLVRFRHLQPPLRYLLSLVLFTAVIEVVSRIRSNHYQSNLFLLPLDTLVEFGLLAGLYRQALSPSAVSRWLPAVAGLFALVSLFSYREQAAIEQFNTVQRFAESLLVLGLVLLYFYKVIRELAIIRLEREPMFWISVGLLVYFAGNLFVFVFSNYIIRQSSAVSTQLWGIHALLYTGLYALYAWALWIKPSTPK